MALAFKIQDPLYTIMSVVLFLLLAPPSKKHLIDEQERDQDFILSAYACACSRKCFRTAPLPPSRRDKSIP